MLSPSFAGLPHVFHYEAKGRRKSNLIVALNRTFASIDASITNIFQPRSGEKTDFAVMQSGFVDFIWKQN
jgi:hypothetical protein